MIYKRGNVYWYKFKWTVRSEDGTKESYEIRKSARTSNKRDAKEVEEEHRRAIRLGLIHPLDRWPKPPAPQAPRFREFVSRFLEHARLHTKASTATFYNECAQRVLQFELLANALMTEITSEMISKYASWRKSQEVGNSVASINGELRTLRRLFNLAGEAAIPMSPLVARSSLPHHKNYRSFSSSFKSVGVFGPE